MTIGRIIEKIRNTHNCEILPPMGKPKIREDLMLPQDLQEFYEICGGAKLFQESK